MSPRDSEIHPGAEDPMSDEEMARREAEAQALLEGEDWEESAETSEGLGKQVDAARGEVAKDSASFARGSQEAIARVEGLPDSIGVDPKDAEKPAAEAAQQLQGVKQEADAGAGEAEGQLQVRRGEEVPSKEEPQVDSERLALDQRISDAEGRLAEMRAKKMPDPPELFTHLNELQTLEKEVASLKEERSQLPEPTGVKEQPESTEKVAESKEEEEMEVPEEAQEESEKVQIKDISEGGDMNDLRAQAKEAWKQIIGLKSRKSSLERTISLNEKRQKNDPNKAWREAIDNARQELASVDEQQAPLEARHSDLKAKIEELKTPEDKLQDEIQEIESKVEDLKRLLGREIKGRDKAQKTVDRAIKGISDHEQRNLLEGLRRSTNLNIHERGVTVLEKRIAEEKQKAAELQEGLDSLRRDKQ